MKSLFSYTLVAVTAVLLFTQTSQAEARGHYRSTNVQFNVGSCHECRDAYVVRRYAPVMAPSVVYVPATQYVTPVYAAPVYVAPAPVYVAPAPVYVEEMYVPVRRAYPFDFAGLSFSWNFFR